MIEPGKGDLLQADAEALINAVNCVGVMGRGIAPQFRKAFPENFKVYKTVCDAKQLAPGKMLIVDLKTNSHPRYVINFPTKRHWREKSRIEDIETGLWEIQSNLRYSGAVELQRCRVKRGMQRGVKSEKYSAMICDNWSE